MTNRRADGPGYRPDILIEYTEEQCQQLGLPGTATLVIASHSLGFGYSATLANIRGFGPFGLEFLRDVAGSLELESKHIIIRTNKGVVVYESRSTTSSNEPN